MGTTLLPAVFAVLKLVTGIGTRSPIENELSSPSVIRTCGLASVCASVEFFTKSNRNPGTVSTQLF